MSILDKAQKILDSNVDTAISADFNGINNALKYRLVIDGSPNSNIKAFVVEQMPNTIIKFLKVSCDDWNGAIVNLQSKTQHADDNYSNTGDYFYKNELKIFRY